MVHKKILAREVLILFSAAIILCIIYFVIELLMPTCRMYASSLINSDKMQIDAWEKYSLLESIRTITITSLVVLIYPIRGAFYLIRWAINTMKI